MTKLRVHYITYGIYLFVYLLLIKGNLKGKYFLVDFSKGYIYFKLCTIAHFCTVIFN